MTQRKPRADAGGAATGEPPGRPASRPRLVVRQAEARDVDAIVALSERVYGAEASYTPEMVYGQLANFALGQFVAEHEGGIVGYCSTFRVREELALAPHSWREISGGGYGSRHDPAGDWLYGMEVCVDPDFRGQGLGRVLVQSMAKDLIKHGGIGAVEAFGAVRPRPEQPHVECLLPVDFLLAVGFRTHRAHPAYPRMRMDLSTTISWREEFETALERLLGVVGAKRRVPRPSTPTVPRATGPARRDNLDA